jgi:hypothetical protein
MRFSDGVGVNGINHMPYPVCEMGVGEHGMRLTTIPFREGETE